MGQYSSYPNQIDSTSELPIATDNVTPIKAEVVNRQRDAIVAIENELGPNPSSTFSTVKDRLDAIAAVQGSGIAVGDLLGNYPSPVVATANGAKILKGPVKHYVYGISGLQQTGQTSSDEKGAIVFDPSAFFAGDGYITRTIQAVAVLECGLGGNAQTCSLEFFNITDGVTITTLTTQNSTATIVSRTVLVGSSVGQLPNSQKLYGLRLTRTGGTSTDLVSCKMARLEIIYS